MTNLPEWISVGVYRECDCPGCDAVGNLQQACVIAWKALGFFSRVRHSYKAKNAMRQIDELGKR